MLDASDAGAGLVNYRLISILSVQVARLLRLVYVIEPALLAETKKKTWILVIRGRGFTRILRDEQILSPHLLRPIDPYLPRPMQFPSRKAAQSYARRVGLAPKNTAWCVLES